MSPLKIIDILWIWTPYMANGFVWNIVISLTSMILGTIIGFIVVLMRISNNSMLSRLGKGITTIARNSPTFVLLFYLAFLIPVEIEIGDHVYAFPAWIKAALALAVAVTGFVSDNGLAALRDFRDGRRAHALLFLPSWTTYFLMTTMASTTGSVIGVSEILSRANGVIGAVNQPEIMSWVYLYAMLWFMVFCFPITLVMKRIRRGLSNRAEAHSDAS